MAEVNVLWRCDRCRRAGYLRALTVKGLLCAVCFLLEPAVVQPKRAS